MIRLAPLVAVAALALAGCHSAPSKPVAAASNAEAAPSDPASLAPLPFASSQTPEEEDADVPPEGVDPRASLPPAGTHPATDKDPRVVLDAWKAAVEARDWRLVRAYWGDHGQMSGQTPAAFAAKWGKLKAPKVSLGPGDQEGAAGSSFYELTVTILDGSRTIAGTMTWRRVNDVDGATPEQLRWHVEKSALVI